MANTLILTIMGADQPGLVAEMAGCVADHEGNWLESRLVRLGGQFAGVLRVEVPQEKAEALVSALQTLQKGKLVAHVEVEKKRAETKPAVQLLTVEVVGADRPGILKALSEALSRHAVNIEELSTERRTAPMSGVILFEAHAVINLRATTPLPELHEELAQIADDLMIELVVGENN